MTDDEKHEILIDSTGENIVAEPDDIEALAIGAALYQVNGNFDAAIADYTSIIRLKPSHAGAFYGRAIARKSARVDIELVMADLDESIRLDPARFQAFFERGFNYLANWDIVRAISDFDKTTSLDENNAGAFYLRGSAYALKGDWVNAIADYSEAIRIDQSHEVWFLDRGIARLKSDDCAGALADFDRAIEIDPVQPSSYRLRGGVYEEMGELELASSDFVEWSRLALNDPAAEQAITRVDEKLAANFTDTSLEEVYDIIMRGDPTIKIDLFASNVAIESRNGRNLHHAIAAAGSVAQFRRAQGAFTWELDWYWETYLDNDGRHPFHIAAQHGNIGIMKEFIFLGIDHWTLRDKLGRVPISYATEHEQDEAARYLYKQLKGSPFHLLCSALAEGDSKLACWIIEQDGTREFLMEAAGIGDLAVCKFLVGHGARVNNWNEYNWAPLHNAIGSGTESVVRFLLESGADANDWAMDLSVKYYWPISPLFMAVRSKQRGIAEALLDHGADPNDGVKGFTNLYQAPGGKRSTPLHVAAKCGELDLVLLLLGRGARPNTRDEAGATPLHMAALHGDDRIAKALVEAGAERNVRDKIGNRPYDVATLELHLRTRQLVKVSLAERINYRFWASIEKLKQRTTP